MSPGAWIALGVVIGVIAIAFLLIAIAKEIWKAADRLDDDFFKGP